MRSSRKLRPTRVAAALGMAAALLLSACIDGPIPGTPTLSIGIDPTRVDYTTTEVFLGQYADAYQADAPLTADGRWSVSPDPATSGELFKTRMVVLRPERASDFNGTVYVEWMNVTGQADLPVDWAGAHREIVRQGAMYVGVSAQAVGVNHLKTVAPERYSSLVHPGDSYSYSIFSLAARSIRTDRKVTGGLKPRRLIGMGQSQSAGRLVTYINAVQPQVGAFDGFIVHSRGTGGSSLSQSPLASVPVPNPTAIRDDLDVPVFVLMAEDDVIRSNTGVRQPDTSLIRTWEMAGTSHLDVYLSRVTRFDYGDGAGSALLWDEMRSPRPIPTGCAASQNAGGLTYLLRAAFHHMDAWARGGAAPPTAAPFATASTSPTVLQRDAQGNALGGVRSVQVDVPIATIDGINSGGGFCGLFGGTSPLSDEELQARYDSQADFLAEYEASLDALVAGGYLLQVDADELLATATAKATSLPLPAS